MSKRVFKDDNTPGIVKLYAYECSEITTLYNCFGAFEKVRELKTLIPVSMEDCYYDEEARNYVFTNNNYTFVQSEKKQLFEDEEGEEKFNPRESCDFIEIFDYFDGSNSKMQILTGESLLEEVTEKHDFLSLEKLDTKKESLGERIIFRNEEGKYYMKHISYFTNNLTFYTEIDHDDDIELIENEDFDRFYEQYLSQF